MPTNDGNGSENGADRRSVLKAIGAGAIMSLGVGAGVAAADDATASGNCWYEYKCLELICPYADDDGGSTEERRQCCEDADGNVTCGDWEVVGCCTLSA